MRDTSRYVMSDWLPDEYCTVMQAIERCGTQLFGNSWSGGESQAGRLKPPEYWQAFEGADKREQERRRSHAVQARKAAGTYLGPSRTAPPRRGQSVPPPKAPDYRESLDLFMADVAAAERWKDATNKILNAIYEGDAPLSEVRADGVLVAIPSQSVLSPSWQQLLGDPRSNRKFILPKSFLTALSAQAAVEPAPTHETAPIVRAANDAAGAGTIIPLTGLQGRPSKSWHLIECECRRRYADGERHMKTIEWADALKKWLGSEHPTAAVPSLKTLTNKLVELLRKLRAA